MAAAIPPFALFPGMASDQPLNFTAEKDVKFFKKAIEGLDSKFDLKPENLTSFLQRVQERAQIYNWNTILNVPSTADPAILQNVITQYGKVTLEECKAHATTYMAANNRQSQNAVMLYQFLSNSMSSIAQNTLHTQTKEYTIGNYKEGLCFLRVIIAKAHVDTIATVNALRTSISNLDHKMIEFKGNIKEFHKYVRQVSNSLSAYSQKHDELLVNLFKAYASVQDEEFREYIRSKRHAYEDGSNATMTEDTIMTNAENHYDMRVEAGTWKIVDKKTERIIALETEIKSIKSDKNPKGDGTSGNNNNETKWAWKNVEPKTGEARTRNVKGTKYHWCPTHKMWTVHTPEQCEGILPRGTRPGGSSNSKSTTQSVANTSSTSTLTMQMDPAMESIIMTGGTMTE